MIRRNNSSLEVHCVQIHVVTQRLMVAIMCRVFGEWMTMILRGWLQCPRVHRSKVGLQQQRKGEALMLLSLLGWNARILIVSSILEKEYLISWWLIPANFRYILRQRFGHHKEKLQWVSLHLHCSHFPYWVTRLSDWEDPSHRRSCDTEFLTFFCMAGWHGRRSYWCFTGRHTCKYACLPWK